MTRSDVHPAAWALCLAMVLAVIGCFALAWAGKTIPDLLGVITSGLVASVGTIMAKTRRDPDQVEVVNPPQDPVPVSDA